MEKLCNGCKNSKPIDQFKKHTSTRDKLSNFCDECTNAKQRKYRAETKNLSTIVYEKTRQGYLVRQYRNMLSRVTGVQKNKKHLYDGMEILKKEVFYRWALENPEFNKLYDEYKKSGFKMKLAPSIDREDSSVGYVISNMRFLTHSENSRLGGKNKRILKGELL